MHLAKGLVCAVVFITLLSCGADEVNERRRTSSRISADIKKDDSNAGQTNDQNKPKKPDDTGKPAVPESTLLWDGVELASPPDIMILEME